MAEKSTFVIIGASLAGAKAAETLRKEGFDGRIVLIGDETERPYERPPLSKGYLIGSENKDVIYVHDADWYATHDVELRLGVKATAIDRGAHSVELADGDRLGYTKLLLATGASPRRLDVPGAGLEGVYYLRRVEDSERLKAAFTDGGPVVIIGAGWIGLETAAAARDHGCPVTVVEPAPAPLYRVLGPELGEVFAQLHRDHEVNLRLGTGVTEIRGEGGRTRQVITDDGEALDAATVIVGVGVAPNVDLAKAAGLDVDNGLLVDVSLRTSDPDIYAAGDIANADHPLFNQRIRVEHWANAKRSGPVAARAMLGKQASHDRPPYFYTDQYDLSMEYTGYVAPDTPTEIIYRGEVDAREFIAFWLVNGRLLAGMNVNVGGVTDAIEALIRSGEPVDVARLRDPDVPLEELAARPAPANPARSGAAGTGIKQMVTQGMSFVRHRVTDRFAKADPTPVAELPAGEGHILSVDGEKAAVYRDEQGTVYAVSATCTHMGCTVDWNSTEKTWDCPCHGSRYDHTGTVIRGPAKKDLHPIDINKADR